MKKRTIDIGIVEEKITQISQLFATELHLLKILKKIVAQIENFELTQDQLQALDNKRAHTLTLIEKVTSQRRASQLLIFNYLTKKGYEIDYDFWCVFKHMSGAEMCAYESLQAIEPTDELYIKFEQDLIDTAKIFTEILSITFGLEITDCAACLSDMLKGIKDDEGVE